MSIDFNLKSPAILVSNSQFVLWAWKPGIDFSSVAMKVLDGRFFQYKAILSALDICLA
jgi:hypothetical protein